MFIAWSTFKILCYQSLCLEPWRWLQRNPLFVFFLQFISSEITSRPAKVTKSWRISLVPSHMEHLDIPHDFFHSYFVRRKKKIWPRGAACLWSPGCPDQKTPSGSSRNKAGTLSRCIIYCSHLLPSKWPHCQVRSVLLLSRCFAFTLALLPHFPFFSAFLPSTLPYYKWVH